MLCCNRARALLKLLPADCTGMVYTCSWKGSQGVATFTNSLPKFTLHLQLRVAKQHLTRLAKQSGQRRFAPADLDAFLASLPDTPSDTVPEAGHGRPQGSRDNPSDRSDVENGDGEEARRMGDALFVPEERRGGPRQKGLSKSIRAMLKGKQRRVSPGEHHCSSFTGAAVQESSPETQKTFTGTWARHQLIQQGIPLHAMSAGK